MSLASLGPMGRKGRPSLYRMALVAGFLSLNAVFWYLAIKAIALLGLLEVIFGITWAWVGAGEQPALSTLFGGSLVIVALVFNEAVDLVRQRRRKGSAVPATLA